MNGWVGVSVSVRVEKVEFLVDPKETKGEESVIRMNPVVLDRGRRERVWPCGRRTIVGSDRWQYDINIKSKYEMDSNASSESVRVGLMVEKE